jgi:hypothetical protein
MNAGPFTGGAATLRKAGIAAAAGLAVTAILGLLDARRALWAYHVAFVYWAGIALAALILLLAMHAMKARWGTVMRRVLETIPLSALLFLALFVPIALGLGQLFPWVHPERLEGELRHLAEHRAPWLNAPFFVLRAFLYLAVFAAIAHLIHRMSVRQDREKGFALTASQRRLSAGALPLVALVFTAAAFDWQMSLDLHLSSTIFGVYWFAGSFLSAIAVLILAVNGAAKAGILRGLLRPSHYHSLGKLLLAFVVFWAYIAISQYLLIWIANIPEEVPWYLHRSHGGWKALSFFLLVFHFLVPFALLLSAERKKRPRALGAIAVYVLVIHYVDVYWVVMPALHPEGPRPHLADLTAVLGVGAAALAFVVWRLRGRAAIPVGDPYLEDSLRYDPS